MNTVIFYPYIYPNERWLRVASLCWDDIYTLKTNGAFSQPSSISLTNNALGNPLKHINLHDKEETLIEVDEQFLEWLDEYDTDSDLLEVNKKDHALKKDTFSMLNSKLSNKLQDKLISRGVARLEEGEHQVDIPSWVLEWEENDEIEYVEEEVQEYPAPIPGTQYAFYCQALEEGNNPLADEIRKQNLVTVTSHRPKIILDRKIALHYLSLCARYVAEDGSRDLIADERAFAETAIWSLRDMRGDVSFSTLEARLPEDIENIEIARLVDARSALSTRRLEYQKEVDVLCKDLESVTSESELKSIKARAREISKKKIEDIEHEARNARLNLITKGLSISLAPPSLTTALSSALGVGVFLPAGIVAAISLFGAQMLLARENIKTQARSKPWSYAIEVEKHVNG